MLPWISALAGRVWEKLPKAGGHLSLGLECWGEQEGSELLEPPVVSKARYEGNKGV